MTDYYGNVDDVDAWHLEHGNAVWATKTTGEKLAALLIASEWLDSNYESSFDGYRTGKTTQDRAWPRTGAHDAYGTAIADDVVPVQIEQATYEVALRQAMSPGSLSVDWTPGKEKLSVAVQGAVSVTYRGAMTWLDAQVQIGSIGGILRPIFPPDGVGNYAQGLFGFGSRI